MENSKPYKIKYGAEKFKLKLEHIELSCFILENNSRVFTKDSIQKAMGYLGKSEDWLNEFLIHINRITTIDPELLEELPKSILFQIEDSGDKTILKQGILAKMLIDACQAITKANNEGFLYLSEQKFARAAEVILKNTTGKNVDKLIDFATGYELFKQNQKDNLARYMGNNSSGNHFAWIKTLPDGFFEKAFVSMDLNWTNMTENIMSVANYADDIVFSRLDNQILELLASSKPRMKYRKVNTPEQFLEHPKLKEYLHVITGLHKASGGNQGIFEQLLNKTYPKKTKKTKNSIIQAKKNTFDSQEFFGFNENLKKALAKSKK
ncbi:MAG TPA: hypothetical protein VK623_04860 [Flavobacterium sp.]|nr:hypothetical protein [Flavobacterium sp.]